MTTATMALTGLAEKGADIDMLRQMVQFMAQRLMDLGAEARCGTGYDDKSPERLPIHHFLGHQPSCAVADPATGFEQIVRAAFCLARSCTDLRGFNPVNVGKNYIHTPQ